MTKKTENNLVHNNYESHLHYDIACIVELFDDDNNKSLELFVVK